MIYHSAGLHNIAELFEMEGKAGQGICRIPLAVRAQLNERAQANAIQAAGCEIRFNLEGEYAEVILQMETRPAIAEVYHGPFLGAWSVIQTYPTALRITQPEKLDTLRETDLDRGYDYDPNLIRIILPWRPPVRILDVQGKINPPQHSQTPARTYLAYGSSISHGNNSISATGMFSSLTAQNLKADLINLGFGGGAHCEAVLAQYIAGRDDWDFASLELGINMVGWLEVSEFADRIMGFVKTIAEAHPEKWIFCIDMLPFYMDFNQVNTKNHAYRVVVRETITTLNLPKLVHIDGQDLLRDMRGLSADLLHPSPRGMEEIARNLSVFMQSTWHNEYTG